MKSGTFKIIGINLLVTLLLLVALEGLASLFLAAKESGNSKPAATMAEDRHTRFDPLLGWINLPDIRIDNMYGKGVYLATNSQAFRNEKNFPNKKEPGTKRILCVGDSFTLGYGVSNQQTWCHFLSELLPNVETVNMGQGGYGVDQAYLWYKRDGVKLEHDLVLFAFITSDFYRMQNPEFSGHSKPFLQLEGDRLKVTPPQPPDAAGSRADSSAIGAFLGHLQMARFLQKLSWKLKLWGTTDGVLSPQAKRVTSAVFGDLKTITGENQSELLLVHLPNADDYPFNSKTDGLRNTLAEIAGELGLKYVDTVQTLQALPSSFDAQILFQFGNRHFNIEGNRFIARRLQADVQKALSRH